MKSAQDKLDIITIGDSTIDTFIKIRDATVECDIHYEECKICLPYGEKIPVEAIGHGIAGNAANVAIGVKILGLKTAIYTNLGNDASGKSIMAAFVQADVDTRYVEVQQGKESNLSVIITFEGERTALVYHQDWFYKLPNLNPCTWIYYTSVSESFTNSNLVDDICHYIDKSGAKLAFSPGTFQLKADVKRYPKILEKCELFVVNLEEAKKILEIDVKDRVEPRDLLSKLHMLGPKKVVITDSSEGSWGSDGTSDLKLGIVPVQVMEKTGAGDAYTSALIAAIVAGKNLGEAMVWGAINGSNVITKLGPQNGLLTKEELERNRKAMPDFVATKI